MQKDLMILALAFSAVAIFSDTKETECKNDPAKCKVEKVSKNKTKHQQQPKLTYSMHKPKSDSVLVMGQQ